jgi:quercetin dioxygenase-like cupin family protein
MTRVTGTIVLCILLASGLKLTWAQPVASRPGPAAMKVELENDTMTVLRIRMAPHEKTPMHDVSARAVVWLTDGYLRDTAADGSSIDTQHKAGDVEWITARRHAGENLGDTPIEFLAIVPKKPTNPH